jgi:hypothetical protein
MLFHLLTCKPATAAEHAAELVGGLFPMVSALSKYTPVEQALGQRAPLVDFTWKDYDTARFAIDDDLPLLSSLAVSLVNDLGVVSANLDRYVTTNPSAHFELAPLLRTAGWAVYRSQLDLSKAQLQLVLELFEALDRAKLENNINLMELLRFLRVAGPDAVPVLLENFDRLVAIVFGAVYQHRLLPAWNFVLFIDSFKPLLELYPALFQVLFASPLFLAAFAAAARCRAPDVLRGFAKLAGQQSVDITPLVATNWQLLVEGHGFTAVDVFSRCPTLELTDEIYTRLIVLVLATAAASQPTKGTQEALRAAAAYLISVGEGRQLTELAELKKLIPEVIARVANRKSMTISQELSQLLLAATRQSRELREWARPQIKEEASAALASLKLRFELHDTEGIDGRVALAAVYASIFPLETAFDQGPLFQVFTELVVADGFEQHRGWANAVFEAICRRYQTGPDEQVLVKAIAKQLDGEQLVVFARELREHFSAAGFPDSIYLLAKLNLFAGQHPEICDALLEAGGFVGDTYAHVEREYGSTYVHIFKHAEETVSK